MKTYEYQRPRSLFDLCRSFIFILSKTLDTPKRSKATGLIMAKFHMGSLRLGEKGYSNDPGHVIKMATTLIYGKKHLTIFSGTKRPMTFKLGIQH